MDRSVLVRRTAPAAVFVAVLAVLVAVMALGNGGGSDPRTGEPRLLPLSMGFRAQGEGAPRDAAAGSTRAAYSGEVVIPDRLLAGLPTEGPVLTVRAGDTAPSRIAALAKALGVPGDVRGDAEGWVVGDGDVVLRVLRQPGSPWYLGMDKVAVARDGGSGSSGSGSGSGGTVGVATAAPATTEPKPDPGGSDTPVSNEPTCKPTPEGSVCVVEPAPADCPPPADGTEPACEGPEPSKPPQPSDDEARAVTQRVFAALGLTGATITVNDAWSAKEVVAAPVVGGLPTAGFETRVSVDVTGAIPYASGFLGAAEADATYPLLTPREAVERGGAYGGVRADIAIAPCPPETPCPTPEPREATGVRLGLLFLSSYDADQGAFLVPAWLLTFEGSTWEEPVLALPDRYIATPPPANDLPGTIEPDTTDPGPGEVPPDGGDPSGETAGGSAGGPEPGTAAPE